jgi:organic radical activating enzyme
MDENDILKTIKVNVNPKQCQLVVITGGEPLAQNLSPLLELLHSGYSYFVQIETSGVTCREENLEMLEHCVIVCSPKTPKIDKKLQPLIDFYKYVGRVSECDDDGLPSALLNGGSPFVYRDKHRLVHAPHTVFLNPLDEGDAVLNQANLVFVAEVCMRNNWRMGVQLHKLANLR